MTHVHRQAIQDLKTILRHMKTFAHMELKVETLADAESLKRLIHEYNAAAAEMQEIAITDIEVLFDAIEYGVDISELVDYEDFVAWRNQQKESRAG